MNIVFAGTPHFADSALQALLAQPQCGHADDFKVVAVFTQPDRPSGRGLKLTPSPVKLTALANGIPVHQPRSLKIDGKYPDDARVAQAVLADLKPDVMVVAAYGLLLPQWTLDAPRAGCINIHASLLPRWRGAAPIQRAIEAGDTVSGVCLMRMDIGLDTGGVYAQRTVPIGPSTTGGALHDALALEGAQLLCEHLTAIASGALIAAAQSESGVSYAHKLLREHGQLDWQRSAAELALQVRGYDPSPGCSFEHAGQSYKVWAAQSLESSSTQAHAAGTVLAVSAQGLDMACGAHGSEVLRITQIQKAGGKRLSVAACWQSLQSLQNTPGL